MTIQRINSELPTTTKISQLNQMALELNGLVQQGKFDINELDEIYNLASIARRYLRNQGIGNTTSTYTNWSHLYAEAGYSIWKYTPTNYTYNALNQLYIDNVVLTNRGAATSESATTFDKVFLFNGDSGSGYVDDTTEAGTSGGTGFNINDTTHDYTYLGLSATFAGTKFIWKTRGSNYTLKLEYWNGSAWTQLTYAANNLVDNTNNFQSDGHINWTIPTDWATTTVNSVTSKYWIRVSTTTNPITVANAYYIIPASSVIGLLALSSAEVLAESWAWCSFSGSIYATIRNQGSTTYEGNYYINSSSSTANKQNYFVYNNPFTADYESSLYNPVKEITANYTVLDTDAILLVNSIGNVTINLPAAHTREGRQYVIKKTNSGSTVTIDGASGDRIDGATTKTLTIQYTFYRIVSDGANWWIIGGGSL